VAADDTKLKGNDRAGGKREEGRGKREEGRGKREEARRNRSRIGVVSRSSLFPLPSSPFPHLGYHME